MFYLKFELPLLSPSLYPVYTLKHWLTHNHWMRNKTSNRFNWKNGSDIWVFQSFKDHLRTGVKFIDSYTCFLLFILMLV